MEKHSHKKNDDVQQRLKRQKYSLLKDMSYPKNFAGNILMFFLVNIKCGFIATQLCLQILFSRICFEVFLPFTGQNNL